MFNCILNNDRAEVVCCAGAGNSCTGDEYSFELSSACTEAEASAVAREIEGLFKKTDPRERNVARIERFLGALDVLYQNFCVVWENNRKNIRDWLSNYRRTENDRFLLEKVAGKSGI